MNIGIHNYYYGLSCDIVLHEGRSLYGLFKLLKTFSMTQYEFELWEITENHVNDLEYVNNTLILDGVDNI